MRLSVLAESAVTLPLLAIVSAAIMTCGGSYPPYVVAIATCSCLMAGLLYYRPNATLRIPRAVFTPNAPDKEHPPIFVTILFLVLLSGPPEFRARDPLASVRGEMDIVTIIHVMVWALAGFWISLRLGLRFMRGRELLRFSLPLKLGLLLTVFLGASTLVSEGPALTAYMVYQILMMLLFGSLFVEEYGVGACLRHLFVGYAVLSIAIALSIFFAPGLVDVRGGARVRGDLIAPTGVVATFALILLLTNAVKVSKTVYVVFLGLDVVLLGVSRTRTAYAAVLAFLLFAILVRPAIAPVRRLISAGLAALAVMWVAGLAPQAITWIVREPESLPTLSDRTGLWTYLTDAVLTKSPWIGLGYYSASRVNSLQYNHALGNAHSGWVEMFVGGGLLSLAVFVLLWGALVACTVRLPHIKRDRFSFASCSLLIAVFSLSLTGWGGFDSGPLAFTFWCLVAILPRLTSASRVSAFLIPTSRLHPIWPWRSCPSTTPTSNAEEKTLSSARRWNRSSPRAIG